MAHPDEQYHMALGGRNSNLRTTGEHNLRISELEQELQQVRDSNRSLLDEYNGMKQRFGELQHTVVRLERQLAKANERNVISKSRIQEWQAYSGRLVAHIKEIEQRLTASPQQRIIASENASRASSPLPLSKSDQPVLFDDAELPRAISPVGMAIDHDLRAIRSVGSSQSTVLDAPVLPTQPTHYSDDDAELPVIVSERTLRRGRLATSNRSMPVKLEPGSPTVVLSSDDNEQMVNATRPALLPQSSNLDATSAHLMTPKIAKSKGFVIYEPPGEKMGQDHAVNDSKSSRNALQPLNSNIQRKRKADEHLITPKAARKASRPRAGQLNAANKEIPPLRSRPKRSLELHDYKVNDEFVGQAFTFLDPVLNPEERMCPSTCWRPECCGDKARRILEVVGKERTYQSDEVVCKRYLGNDWKYILSQFPEHRETMILQAQAMEYQRLHGDRFRCGPPTNTPPGNWRMQMPNTQERLDDQIKSKERKQRGLDERWVEAMRPDGRWKFADEVMDRA